MGRMSHSGGKAERDELRALMLAQGRSVDEVAEEFRARWRLAPLAAYRYAAGLTQLQAAARYNEALNDAGARVDATLISKLEQWPATLSSKAPTAYNLAVLAVVYGTQPHRLVGTEELGSLPKRDQLVLRATIRNQPEREQRCSSNVMATDRDRENRALLGGSESNDERLANPVIFLRPVTDGQEIDELVTVAAYQAQDFAAWAESSTLGATTLEMCRSRLEQLAGDFLHRPVTTLFPELVRVRNTLFGCLQERGHQPLRHQRELYSLAGMACVVLAHASHVLGNSIAGKNQAQLAQLCAQEADHVELLAWTFGTQALLADSAGRPREALQFLQSASEQLTRSRTPGTASVRLASYEAKFGARLGHVEQTLVAIEKAERARDEVLQSVETADLDDIGGILSFPEAKQEFFAAESHILIGQYESAEKRALAAVSNYTGGPSCQYSYGDIALAQLDIAAARLATNDLDGMQEALQPVLTLPVELRIDPLRPPLTTLARSLAQPRYHNSGLASSVRQAIECYSITPREIAPL